MLKVAVMAGIHCGSLPQPRNVLREPILLSTNNSLLQCFSESHLSAHPSLFLEADTSLLGVVSITRGPSDPGLVH